MQEAEHEGADEEVVVDKHDASAWREDGSELGDARRRAQNAAQAAASGTLQTDRAALLAFRNAS